MDAPTYFYLCVALSGQYISGNIPGPIGILFAIALYIPWDGNGAIQSCTLSITVNEVGTVWWDINCFEIKPSYCFTCHCHHADKYEGDGCRVRTILQLESSLQLGICAEKCNSKKGFTSKCLLQLK